MRHITYILFSLFLVTAIPFKSIGQYIPDGINYQAVARDFNGVEMKNKNLKVRITIISGSATGEEEWIEIHSIQTNSFGLFNIVIGQGSRDGGRRSSFSDLQWGIGPHYLKVEIDFLDGEGYLPVGLAQELLSVPYALYSGYAANGGSGGGDPLDFDKDPTNERQNLSQTDTLLQLINNDGTVQSSVKADFDPKNEIQDLLLNSNILKITNNNDANEINLTPYLDNTDEQTLYNNNDSIGITGGNKISLNRFYDNTDQQTLYNKSDSIGISGGNQINLNRFYDNTDAQTLFLETDSMRILGGNAVDITDLRNPESIYFYVEKTTTSTVSLGTDNYIIFNDKTVNIGNTYNSANGNLTISLDGLYSFYVTYNAKTSQQVKVFINNGEYDILQTASNDGKIRSSFMLYLNEGDVVNIVVGSGGAATIGVATWSGFKVN